MFQNIGLFLRQVTGPVKKPGIVSIRQDENFLFEITDFLLNSFAKFLKATSKQQLSTNWKFHIPDLKVGTLDQLVGLSDDLGK